MGGWKEKWWGLNKISTHLNAPGLQLLFSSSQIKGDGRTGIVDPENREHLAVAELCKQTRGCIWLSKNYFG